MKKSGKERRKGQQTTTKYNGKVSLVIPCFNEEERIPLLVSALKRFESKWNGDYEVIAVNDGSSDDTLEKLQTQLPASLSSAQRVEIVDVQPNQGKGNALKAGVAVAEGDFILTLDADMATSPMELNNWLRLLPNKKFSSNEILIASREHPDSKVEGPKLRKVMGLVFNFIIQLFTALQIRDTQCGFKLYPKEIAKQLFAGMKSKGWAHDVELLHKANLMGIKITPMPIKWKHMEGTKIKVVKDSISMFFQVFFIALRTKFNWFVVQPIADLKNKVSTGGESSLFRLGFVAFSLFLLLLMPTLSSDFAITGDETTQHIYGEKLVKYYDSNGENQEALEYKNLKYYGGFFDYIATKINTVGEGEYRYDIYDFRHFVNSLFGFLMILFAGLLAYQVSNSWKVAFFTLLLLALSPRIFGHSMNNPKDIPFAMAFVFSVYQIIKFIKQLSRPSLVTVLLLAIGIAVCINIRVGGVLLIAYLIGFTVGALIWNVVIERKATSTKQLVGVVAGIFVAVVLGFFGGTLFWPYAAEAPWANIKESFGAMAKFETGIRVLFSGEHIWSDRVPWSYIPTWMLLTSPIVVLLGFFASPVLLFLKKKKTDLLLWGIILAAAVAPIGYAILKSSPLYDGMRHFLFVYPLFVILAAWAWAKATELSPNKMVSLGIGGFMAILLLLPTYWMVKSHPYQYIYFNELAGGVSGAYTEYETDYWMNSIKELTEWIAINHPEAGTTDELKIATNAIDPVQHYMRKINPKVRLAYVKMPQREQKDWKYGIFFPRFVDRGYLKSGAFPPEKILYEAKLDGATIGVVMDRETPFALQADRALKAGNREEAIELLNKELQQHPKNAAALSSLAQSYLQLRNFPKTKETLDRIFALTESDVAANGLLGTYHIQTGNVPEAEKAFKHTLDLNYKYYLASYYLALIYQQKGELDQAIDYLEKCRATAGKFKPVYELGVKLYQQKGNTTKAQEYNRILQSL